MDERKGVINGKIREGRVGSEARGEPEKGGLSSEQRCSSSIDSVMSAVAALL